MNIIYSHLDDWQVKRRSYKHTLIALTTITALVGVTFFVVSQITKPTPIVAPPPPKNYHLTINQAQEVANLANRLANNQATKVLTVTHKPRSRTVYIADVTFMNAKTGVGFATINRHHYPMLLKNSHSYIRCVDCALINKYFRGVRINQDWEKVDGFTDISNPTWRETLIAITHNIASAEYDHNNETIIWVNPTLNITASDTSIKIIPKNSTISYGNFRIARMLLNKHSKEIGNI